MDLFSCRNCVQNPMQGTTFGHGHGYCLRWGSVIRDPGSTTCKYLHRKDLPSHLVDEATREHAAEFAHAAGPADLITVSQIKRMPYSEKYAWDSRTFDPSLQAMAMYHRADDAAENGGKARFIQAFVGSIDGRRALAYASLVRRYMHHCDTWTSSYRLVLAIVEEITSETVVQAGELLGTDCEEESRAAVGWEVLYCRISGLQEFAWHASLQGLLHPLSPVYGSIAGMDMASVRGSLATLKESWREQIIGKAKAEGEYFPQPPSGE